MHIETKEESQKWETKETAPEGVKENPVTEQELLHPKMDELQKTIENQKTILSLLEKKLDCLKSIASRPNPTEPTMTIGQVMEVYETTEAKLNIFKVEDQIKSQKRSIQVKEKHFIEYMQGFTVDCNDLKKFYDLIVKKAKAQSTSNKRLKDVLDKVKWEVLDTNIEVKIHLFKELAGLIKH